MRPRRINFTLPKLFQVSKTGCSFRRGCMFSALAFCYVCVWAQAPKPTLRTESSKASTTTTPTSIPQLTAGDVEAFLDGLVPLQLGREDIAGAVILVVKDGKILLSKGYGYA